MPWAENREISALGAFGIHILIHSAINHPSEVLIHGENGRIRERNSYGNDPHPPKG
ncbi:MAG: DUF2188 domain-containing protein [Thiobacillus sp.]|nr:DUF2188 domain-containing protein [Thiobacillus sp.]